MSARTPSPALLRRRTRSGVDVRLTRRAAAEAAVFGAASAVVAAAVSGLRPGLAAALGLIIAMLALGSALAHELAHLLIARRHGLRVLRLEVSGALSGGVTREASTRRGDEIAVGLAGPIATLTLLAAAAAAALALRDGPSFARAVALTTGTVNLAALAGTLPILPGSDISRVWAAWRRRPALRSGDASPGRAAR